MFLRGTQVGELPETTTVYDSLKTMSKDEFVSFCLMLYYKGMNDERHLVDDAIWIQHRLADWPVDRLSEIE